jgi:4'-phosphopantetheinyl transferase
VWAWDLDTPPGAPAAGSDGLIAALSEGERERAAAIVRPMARARWCASRAGLRTLLARYLDASAQELSFEVGATGKPELGDAPFDFNLSHSGRTAVLAISACGPVGVDVEEAARKLRATLLAPRLLGRDGAELLARGEIERLRHELLRCWVRREALAKCRGTAPAGARDDAPATWMTDLPLGPRAVAALACSTAPRELRLWS